MPKLYGAPAYARPPVLPVKPVEKPFDPDALPLVAERTDEDGQPVAELQARTNGSEAIAQAAPAEQDPSAKLHGRPFHIRLPGLGRDGR